MRKKIKTLGFTYWCKRNFEANCNLWEFCKVGYLAILTSVYYTTSIKNLLMVAGTQTAAIPVPCSKVFQLKVPCKLWSRTDPAAVGSVCWEGPVKPSCFWLGSSGTCMTANENLSRRLNVCNEQQMDVSSASSLILRQLVHLLQMAGKLHQYSKSISLLLEQPERFLCRYKHTETYMNRTNKINKII